MVTRSPGHAATVWRRIETYLLPALGQRPVAGLKTRDLLAPLKAVEKREVLDTAGRLRQYMIGIMRIAVQHGRIDTNPAVDLRGATATRKTVHRPALALDRLPELLQRMVCIADLAAMAPERDWSLTMVTALGNQPGRGVRCAPHQRRTLTIANRLEGWPTHAGPSRCQRLTR